MTEEQKTGTEESFISHLIELRSRVMKAAAGVLLIGAILLIRP